MTPSTCRCSEFDPYGNFIPGANGFAQLVVGLGADGIAQTDDDVTVEGNLGAPISPLDVGALRTGQMFLADIAHSANPFSSQGAPLAPDADPGIGDDGDPLTYDDELLAEHFMAGDGRVNENIGLTAVHHVFHAEHNRLVDHTKSVLLSDAAAMLAGGATQAEAVAFLNEWLLADVAAVPAPGAVLQWDGERLFQAAKFGTEMQYQHLVFEEFARKVQPMVDAFLAPEGFDTTINPAIVAEFAHVVYRFGHSMLLETIDRLDPTFQNSEIGLIEAFLNPLAFNESGGLTPEEAAGAIVRGTTRQVGNEIDEFKTEALRNNLLGLPLDLAAINLARGRDTGIPSLNAARSEFYDMTSDSQLKPYTSWADFAQHLKHPESLVNFIAAYGMHSSITSETTLAGKRAAAMAIVFGVNQTLDPDGIPANGDEIDFIVPSDSLDFLNSTGAWASNLPVDPLRPKDFDGVSTTGLGSIDLWIGGLAEKQMPFGGLLGSTFNFVFETQLEALQNGDRFYYLARTAGMNFLTELENNSFSKLVMLHTDTKHLPADIFSTPNFILEVDPTQQFTGLNEPGPDGIQVDDPLTLVDESADNEIGTDGIAGNSDPLGGTALTPLVIRDNPATAGPDTNYLQYTGPDHVVLGGTAGNDIMIASIGDDTLWGDGGNDRLEGGDGVDNIEGGDGDDIITDKGGDDVLKGNDGNDVIHGGNGFNLILGGAGSDFIVTGEDVSETFGGTGNDFIYGAQMNLPTFGNEGDDWIEIGTSDGAGGDNFDPQEDSTVIGHDVFITGGGFDEADGEGGDDIMVFSDGEDHFGGGGGFDWASYKFERLGVSADLNVNDLIEPPVTPSASGILDRFADVEGLSGSAFSDILRGDDATAADIDIAGPLNGVLTRIDLISGLQELLGAGVTSFGTGNIILGGDGSDILEGRGGDDLIDGDRMLNVRVSVRDPNNPNLEIRSVDSIAELIPDMLAGTINPSQLQIVREILPGSGGFNFDTAVFSGDQADYTIVIDDNGTPLNAADDIVTVTDNIAGRDGIDRVQNIERLQFSDSTRVLVEGLNNEPVGQPTISDDTPAVNQLLTVSAAGVSDADSPGGITGAYYVWQVERDPVGAPGVFEDIVDETSGNPTTVSGATFRVTADLDGLALRVKVIYQDGNGVLETVFSDATGPVEAVVAQPTAPTPAETIVNSPGNGLHLIRADLQFILDQILIAEGNPDGNVLDSIANPRLPFGLRTVDGSFNNLVQDQTQFGASDNNFPLLLDQVFRNDLDGDTMPLGPPGSGAPTITNTNYASTISVADADPRIISNLIVDQTITNPVAVHAFVDAGFGILVGGLLHYLNDDGSTGAVVPAEVTLTLPNTTPDEGLSAPFNSWFTFFGQFFDHGLDLVDKGGNGTVYIPLQPDDPLYVPGGANNFMVLTRATNSAVQAGTDGVFGTSDDVHFHNNETTPFVDQNQTYTSNASHQVFLREYELRDIPDDGLGPVPVNTGRLIDGANGGIGNWAEIKAQAAAMLGIQLTDMDVFDVPLLATDAYGKFTPGPNGFAQVVTDHGLVEGVAGGLDLTTITVGGEPAVVARTGHAFLNDIAHNAVPGTVFDTDGNPATPETSVVQADDDTIAGNEIATDFQGRKVAYDDELLDAHFVTGDGRGNENIGLTAVHFVFHAEHNRLVQHIKDVAIASNDVAFLNEWLAVDVLAIPTTPAAIDALQWDGERVFQAARFGTEMQYQHLVFEEFARKVQPQVDVFLAEGQGYDTTINPAIVAEFAHVVYRFGHSMLPDTVGRLDPNFVSSEIGLIEAFLNPLEFTASGATDAEAAGAIVRGVTRQVGNEIDEFVTEAVRNNLLGLPLDLPAINLARGRDTGVPSLNQARDQFYEWTGDSQLKPYASWADFAQHIKHEESLVNFIAAYGTHTSITTETTTAGKRAAAYALVYGENGFDGIPGSGDEPTVAVPSDRLAFLNATGAYAPDGTGPNDDSLGGLNNVDLWIGGLAEKQMPFGGLLGSTFNYVFENQMEKLQNGDRFYYLERTAGLNFLTELENNSFAKLIMANTDTTHLAGDVFSTPAFIIEVDQALQFTGLGPDGRDDPTDEDGLALVIRNNPGTETPDPNYLQYIGEDHVVLGGTAANDTIISSIGDDTLYGDGGNDRLEGGDGVDIIFGGTGDDIITDQGGDDNLQGQDGNDAIHGGNGINLILGGFGNDFIVTGEDESEAFGGPGNDFIFGVRPVEMIFGNEGDDWIEHGMADGSAGENFDVRGLNSIVGNDVFMGDTVSDRMGGEGGDDIMVGNGGTGDRYLGASGFDWAVFQHDTLAANVDMNLRAFDETPVPLSVASSLARFESVEGLSGSAFSDILRGDDADAAVIAASGFTGSVLTNFALIDGLQEFVGIGVTSFGAGNIILGGDGSDIIEGRGGDDLIDGDLALNVRISVRANADGTGGEIDSVDSMTELTARVFAGEINPGQLVIVREILPLPAAGGPDFDTAFFSDVLANYLINGQPFDPNNPPTPDVNGFYTVAHVVGGVAGPDGTDRLSNIERLQFADQSIVLGGLNNEPLGLLTIDDDTPAEDQLLTVSTAGVTDADNPGGAITGPVSYVWQVDTRGDGVFEDIIIPTGLGDIRATGTTFTPGDAEVGLALRVKAVYQDANGVLETVFSAPTALVENVNDAPTGAPTISDATPTEGRALTVDTNTIIDPDGTDTAVAAGAFAFQWQQSADGVVWTDIAGANGQLFVPTQAQVGLLLRVVVSYVDDGGTPESVTSFATDVVGDLTFGDNVANTLVGTAGQDEIFGQGGNDIITALGGNDILDGGLGNDQLDGGTGADNMMGGVGNDTYRVDHVDDTVVENLGEGTDIVQTSLNTYVLDPNVETLTFMGVGNFTGTGNELNNIINGNGGADTLSGAGGDDILNGNAGNDILIGGIGNNSLVGGADNDILNGGVGNDLLNGGAGIDTASFADESDAFFVNLVAGTSRRGSAANPIEDTLVGIENVTSGSGHDTISGTGAANTLDGGAGNDMLIGGAANDVLIGGLGNDTFTYTLGHGADTVAGGAGTDTLSITGTAAVADVLNVIFNGTALTNFEGGTITGVELVTADLLDGLDTLTYAGTTAGVTVNLATGSASGFTSIAGIENVSGGSGNDTLTGDGLVNNLNGGAGNDTLDGGLGNDTLVGGLGDDTYFANNGDILTEGAGAGSGIDSVFTASNIFTLAANVENLTFTGAGNFAGTGNASNNVITGGAGNDLLNSAGGADTLIGGAGNDIMNGGAGNDMFVFTAGFGNDIISGFDANPGPSPPDLNQDLLDISGLTAGNFAARVSIVDLGADTVVTIDGTDTITLLGVNGVGANIITQQDFLLH